MSLYSFFKKKQQQKKTTRWGGKSLNKFLTSIRTVTIIHHLSIDKIYRVLLTYNLVKIMYFTLIKFYICKKEKNSVYYNIYDLGRVHIPITLYWSAADTFFGAMKIQVVL